MEIPSIKISPVKTADNNANVTNNAINRGSLHFVLSHCITGEIIKYKNIEKTNGTKIVFIE